MDNMTDTSPAVEENIRLRTLVGKVDKQSVLTITPENVANSGENLVTELAVELPGDLLASYRLYFEFLLPTKQRFISEPLTAKEETINSINEQTRQPSAYTALVVRYKIPAYVARVAGPLVVNLKATNDSVTIYKSKTFTLKVDDSVNPEYDDRYFQGDLLDYLVIHKIDYMKYIEGYLHVYTTNPTTGESQDVDQFPINPLFDSYDAAADWAMNDDEATIGQLVTVIYTPPEGEYEGERVTAYLINPDRTLSHLMTEGYASYEDLIDKPYLNTMDTTGDLEPQEYEQIIDVVKLSKLSKTGKATDVINDRNLVSRRVFNFTEVGTYNYTIMDSMDRGTHITLVGVDINNPLNPDDVFTISLGNDTDGWTDLLTGDDIDVSLDEVSYTIDQTYDMSIDKELRVVIDSQSTNFNIDVIIKVD